MINGIPVFGWIIDFILKLSMAVPFWLVWSKFGIGAKFFYFLPDRYLSVGFWETVGFFIVVGILKGFIPYIVKQSNQQNVNNK